MRGADDYSQQKTIERWGWASECVADLDGQADEVRALAGRPEDGVSLVPIQQALYGVRHADILEIGVVNGALGQHFAPAKGNH